MRCAAAVAHCHSVGVFHCDVKPENVLLTPDGAVRLCDFGSATFEAQTVPMSLTRYYVAPEVHALTIPFHDGSRSLSDMTPFSDDLLCSPIVPARVHAEKVDIWAMGVLLFVLLTGRPPFAEPSVNDTAFAQLVQGCFAFPDTFPVFLRDLFLFMMKPDAALRPTVREVQDRLAALPGRHNVSAADQELVDFALTADLRRHRSASETSEGSEVRDGAHSGAGSQASSLDSSDSACQPSCTCCRAASSEQKACGTVMLSSAPVETVRLAPGLTVDTSYGAEVVNLRDVIEGFTPKGRPPSDTDVDSASSVTSGTSSFLCYSTARIDLDGGYSTERDTTPVGAAPPKPKPTPFSLLPASARRRGNNGSRRRGLKLPTHTSPTTPTVPLSSVASVPVTPTSVPATSRPPTLRGSTPTRFPAVFSTAPAVDVFSVRRMSPSITSKRTRSGANVVSLPSSLAGTPRSSPLITGVDTPSAQLPSLALWMSPVAEVRGDAVGTPEPFQISRTMSDTAMVMRPPPRFCLHQRGGTLSDSEAGSACSSGHSEDEGEDLSKRDGDTSPTIEPQFKRSSVRRKGSGDMRVVLPADTMPGTDAPMHAHAALPLHTPLRSVPSPPLSVSSSSSASPTHVSPNAAATGPPHSRAPVSCSDALTDAPGGIPASLGGPGADVGMDSLPQRVPPSSIPRMPMLSPVTLSTSMFTHLGLNTPVVVDTPTPTGDPSVSTPLQ